MNMSVNSDNDRKIGNNFIWEQKYRPDKIDDIILPEKIKSKIKDYIQSGYIPPLLFSGSSGLGKTTLAIAICKELGVSYTIINASLDRNIDTLRDRIIDYASTKSVYGDKKKAIILDEYDFTSVNSMQAMRGVLDKYSQNCFFIATCNYPERITDALKSRFQIFDFSDFDKSEIRDIKIAYFKRLKTILDAENIRYDSKDVVGLINNTFPDIRKMISILQSSVVDGVIEQNALVNQSVIDIKEFFSFIQEGKFDYWRKWVSNALISSNYNTIFNIINKTFLTDTNIKKTPENVSNFCILLANYLNMCTNTPDHEIVLSSFAADCFNNIEFEQP